MRLFSPATFALLLSCGGTSLEVLSRGDASIHDATASETGAAESGVDAGLDAASDAGARASYCSGSGSPVIVAAGDAGASYACLGGLSAGSFRWALCTCDGIVTSAPITTDSFNSTNGAYDASAPLGGGGLGTNGPLSAGTVTVGGTLWGSDDAGVTLNTATASAELHVAGRISVGPQLSVGENAYVLGDIIATGDVTVGGTLYQPASDSVNAGGTSKIAATSSAPFTVPAACDCAPSLQVNVAAYVNTYATENDDSAVGISPDVLDNVTTDTTLSIPCGRIYFTRVGGSGAVHLELAPGRTAIFIGGDLSPGGDFSIDLPPTGEVDLFVAGNVVVGGTFTLGSAAVPAAARLWVGGSGTINLPSATTIAGNVYAPRAELVLGTATTTVYGSVFAACLSSQGAVVIHYDEAVLSEGESCAPSSGSCRTCHDCVNQACIGGACGACAQSSDCCAPLVCVSGKCVPTTIP